jgi:hypothetical protein
MRVDGVGELTDHGYWRLVYDSCGHVQEFARQGIESLEQAEVYTRRKFARCLMCPTSNGAMVAETGVLQDEIHLVLNANELSLVLEPLRQSGAELLAHRFAGVLREIAGRGRN